MTRVARFYYWLIWAMSGKIEVTDTDLHFIMSPEYYWRPQNSEPIP